MRASRRLTRSMSLAAASALAVGIAAAQIGTVRADDLSPTVTVHPGDSIQKAIDAAKPGTTIVVEPGTYAENLVIPTDGITLRGGGGDDEDGGPAKLVPPAQFAPACGETSTAVIGICVADVVGFDPNTGPITKTVKDVHISNLTIKGFTDSGIFMADTSGSHVNGVHSLNNGGYGMFALSSSAVRFTNSVAEGNHEAGFYIGESPKADAVVSHNTAHGNGIGAFFRDSRGGHFSDNTLNGNCVGMMVLNTGSGPSGAGDVVATDNTTDGNTLACPAGDGPPLSGMGVAVFGADHVTLGDGTADDNTPSGGTPASGGVVVGPTPRPNGAPSSDVTIDEYSMDGNSTDLVVRGALSSVHLSDISCETSQPAALC